MIVGVCKAPDPGREFEINDVCISAKLWTTELWSAAMCVSWCCYVLYVNRSQLMLGH